LEQEYGSHAGTGNAAAADGEIFSARLLKSNLHKLKMSKEGQTAQMKEEDDEPDDW